MYKSLDVHSYKFPYDNVQRKEQETDGVQKLLRRQIIRTEKLSMKLYFLFILKETVLGYSIN